MSCLILMYAASEGEFSSISALKYAKLGISILENLSLRKSSWPETCIEAIRGMESGLRINLDSDSREQTPVPRTFSRRTQRTTLSALSERRVDVEPNGSMDQDEGSSRADPLSSPWTSKRSTFNITEITSSHSTSTHEQRPLSEQAHHPSSYDLNNDQSTIGIETDNMDDYNSAGLVFGDTMGSQFPFAIAAGLDLAPFSTADPCAVTNLWSIADWPWMIHENFS
ncbi:hypothetical protein V6Z79_008966 [Aspergillus fumigatus]